MKELTVTSKLPIVTMNYEEVKESLISTVEKYKGLVVTEQGLKDCKATQKELASIRTKIDTYRKSIKKEMEVPIKNFESQCKELIGLVVEAEEPIKQGILVFDNQRKQAKAEMAEGYLMKATIGLNSFYRSKIDISDITINLSNSMKSIYDEIDNKVDVLAAEQKAEGIRRGECLEVIKETLEEVNEGITTKLVKEDFVKYIDLGFGIVQIIKEINQAAARIKASEENIKKQAEQKILNLKADQEAATLKAEEDAEARIVYLQKQDEEKKEAVIKQAKEEAIREERKRNQVMERTSGTEKVYIDIRVIDNKERINSLVKFLKDNEFEYEITSKGRIK